MNNLHLGAKWLFRTNLYLITIASLGFLFLSFIIESIKDNTLSKILSFNSIISFGIMIFFFIILLVIFEIYVSMKYANWLYEFNEDGLKIESGIIWKKYTTIPYERIQNVNVTRGIVAQIFNFSSMEVQTVGYSNPDGVMIGGIKFRKRGTALENQHSEGYLPAIEFNEAEKIREQIMKKIKQTN